MARWIMHSGGRANVVVTPDRLTVEIGSISWPLSVVVSQFVVTTAVDVVPKAGEAATLASARAEIA